MARWSYRIRTEVTGQGRGLALGRTATIPTTCPPGPTGPLCLIVEHPYPQLIRERKSDMFRSARIARLVLGIAVACIFVSFCGTSRAGFLDTFNTENGGVGKLDYTSFANWIVTAGSVDLIGNGLFDIYPGNGLYVDLNGSTGVSGTLTSKVLFSPGTYEFSFEIGNTSVGAITRIP